MIPQVKDWNIKVSGIVNGRVLNNHLVEVMAPTKRLAILGFRIDFPGYWGYTLKVSPKK